MLTGEQLRAARALIKMEQAELAEKSGVSIGTIRRLEGLNGRLSAQEATLDTIKRVLSARGVTFIEEDETPARGGVGVRLAESTAIDRWNAQMRMIVEQMAENLEIELEDRGITHAALAGAIEAAAKDTYDHLERDIRDVNTPDMLDELYRQDYEGLFKGEAGSKPADPNAVKKRLRAKQTSGDESE